MTTQPEALWLADTIEEDPTTTWGYREAAHAAAAELRRLHAVNKRLEDVTQKLLEALCCVRDMVGHPDNLAFIDAAIAKAEAA